ncbi:hypothetical protein [Phenylobacterium sp. J367]|nr:hypothetical protein [Phenylobacterium sp. J367]MCR5880080.1 hypothetical protein [Phenylobacterium sp. J367]OHB26687.1 MAG: hypothetical protein A2790_17630 [Phenylobacterium sp. RIFCSPHIGHO2_01_FULL_69_31]
MALAALVLTVLTLGPGLDGLLCRDEGSLSAVAAEMPIADAAADHLDPRPLDERPGICVHGHCHHSAPYVPATPPASELSAPLLAVAHPFVRDRVPTSDPKFGLIRPPRA